AEIIWERGTNRAEFFRGEVNKYGWVDIGSSFLPSEIIAAYLWAQVENLEDIQKKRVEIWKQYYNGLKGWAKNTGIKLPVIPDYATNNGHMFYLICDSLEKRNKIIKHLKESRIHAVFHYISLHNSDYYKSFYPEIKLARSEFYTDTLLRLPFYNELSEDDQKHIISVLTQL
ncbi:MAG: DegT/DnrJ/EryC1/StrS family aminotransferase, partial [bacterium]